MKIPLPLSSPKNLDSKLLCNKSALKPIKFLVSQHKILNNLKKAIFTSTKSINVKAYKKQKE